ncbi:MAG: CRISPR-associated endonuclease Cas1 [Planctomycetaceae bacterium]
MPARVLVNAATKPDPREPDGGVLETGDSAMRLHGNTLYVQTSGAYLHKDGETVKVEVEREIVAAKIQNSRTVLLRAAREAEVATEEATLRRAVDRLECSIQALPQAETLNVVRGCRLFTAC